MGIDDREQLGEEPTPSEIALVCRDILAQDICDEIALQQDTEAALALAFSAISGIGEDPEAYLIVKGILE